MDQVDPLISAIYRWFDVSGVLLMGIIGGTIARHRGYDIIGFFFIAMLSALGGGMLRDVLINEGTVAAMSQPEYLILAFTGAVIARFTYFKGRAWSVLESHGDAFVSALWAATGASKALTYGLPVLPAIMMGVFTATGGGMIRDVVTGREPSVFGNNQPTVIPAVACSVIVLIGHATGHMAIGMVFGPMVSFGLFLLGYYGNWRISTNSEFAPVNQTAAHLAELARKAERRSRNIARELEPTRVRSWRHRQMEKALQRRIESEVKRGKGRKEAVHEADAFLQEFTSQFEAIDAEDKQDVTEEASTGESLLDGIGVDLSGDSYDEDRNLDQTASKMLDMILQDDKLTDELIERLVKQYEARNS